MLEVMFFLGFVAIFIFVIYIKRVPPHTVLIIDRDSHYLKTKKNGFYFFNPSRDKVTTEISKRKIRKNYINSFETHDGAIVIVQFSVEYHAEDIDSVLRALELVRRSVDDVLERIYLLGNEKSHVI